MKLAGLIITSVLGAAGAAAQSAPAPDQVVAALKQNLGESQKRLRQYEWIETTTISHNGEQKSQKQQRVYYGADGTLVKLPLGEAAPQEPQGGRRGGRLKQRVVENKKEDLKDYMEKAAGLIHQYVPPDPAKIQTAKDAGKLAVRPQPDGTLMVECRDYVQPSDMLTIGVDAKAALLSALSVATYLEKPEDAVALNVRFGTLADGTSYTAQSTLDVKAKNIRVVVANSGHRPMGQR